MNDYTLYLVKRAYYKKQLIKQAGNPINKAKSKVYKLRTDPEYVVRGINATADKLGVPAKHRVDVAGDALRNISSDYNPNTIRPDGTHDFLGWGSSPQSATINSIIMNKKNIPELKDFKLRDPSYYGLSEGALGYKRSLRDQMEKLPDSLRPEAYGGIHAY